MSASAIQLRVVCAPAAHLHAACDYRPGQVLDGRSVTAQQIADFDEVECARMARLRRARDRDRYVAAHQLLRREVGAWLAVPPGQVRFDRTCVRCGAQHGRPVVVDPHQGDRRCAQVPAVSLSHSGDLVAVALTSSQAGGQARWVGIDLEEPWPPAREGELAAMVRSPEDEVTGSLRDLWVAKEAVLKAAGVGLAAPMTGLGLRAAATRGWARTARAWCEGTSWWVIWLDLAPGYAAAVAGNGDTPPRPPQTVLTFTAQ